MHHNILRRHTCSKLSSLFVLFLVQCVTHKQKKLLNIMRSPFLTIDGKLFSTQVSEEDLLKYFNRRVANYKQIRGGIIFRDSIPRNATGKLLRRHMRAWAERQSRTDESEKGQIEESEKDRIEDFEKRRS